MQLYYIFILITFIILFSILGLFIYNIIEIPIFIIKESYLFIIILFFKMIYLMPPARGGSRRNINLIRMRQCKEVSFDGASTSAKASDVSNL